MMAAGVNDCHHTINGTTYTCTVTSVLLIAIGSIHNDDSKQMRA